MNIRKLALLFVATLTVFTSIGATQSVDSLTLINADTDLPIAAHDPLMNGATIDLSVIGTSNLNIRANTTPNPTGSVRFGLNGNTNYQTENAAPYALEGDSSGDYNAWTPSVGNYTVTATAYSAANAGGTASTPLVINFAVTNGGVIPPDVGASGSILFIRGGSGTGGFLEGGADEQLSDITDYSTAGGNHGWGELADTLIAEGYTLTQMIEGPSTSNTPIDFTSFNLFDYNVVVMGSNNATYTTAQIDALEEYVRGGGAVLFISDANWGQNWGDAPASDQQFLDRFGWEMNQDNGTYTLTSGEFINGSHPILNGLTSFDGEGVSPITITGASIPGVISERLAPAEGNVRRNTGMAQGPLEANTANDASLAVAYVGNGRIAGHFDRNTFFNLNGAGTDINKDDNQQYARNLYSWLINGDANAPVAVTGDLKRWHRVTLNFDGPLTSETADPNPFTDYRLNVEFSHAGSGKNYTIPGFYAADGDAGATGAMGGNQWKAHFAPDEIGEWTWTASFRTGTDLVGEDDSMSGTPVSFHGATGSFNVTESDAGGRDYRAADRGLIKNRGGHYLTFTNGDVWLKGGPDIPENFMGYTGFDNTPDAGHDFINHVADWNPGDPDWDTPDTVSTTDGRALIGALNFIAESGGNCIYFLPMNIGGDARDTFPTIAEQNKEQYDVSKLEQWEYAFAHAQTQGIFLHFVLAETEPGNENYHDNGNLGLERKLYYRELIARFGHHPGLEWNIGEENDYGSAKHIQFAAFIKSLDAYDHPVTTHINTNQFDNFYQPLLGNNDIDITSFQATDNGLRFTAAENEIEEWRRRSAAAGVPWAISIDEPQKIENDKTDDIDGYPHGRMTFLWPTYLSGGAGFEWYVQEDGGGHSFDQRINDYREMDIALFWTGYATEFLMQFPLDEMTPDKTLASSSAGGTTFCLYKPGETYIMYNRDGGTFSLDLTGTTGTFNVEWLDPRNGGVLQDGTTTEVLGGAVRSLGAPPNSTNEDWVAIVHDNTTIPVVMSAFQLY
jgi:hypothetical protein